MTNAQQLSPQDFAAKIRAKYPGAYDNVGDVELTQKVLDKYPQYQSVVQPRGGAGGSWEPEGFWEALKRKAADIGNAQIEAWKNGGGLLNQDSDVHQMEEGFNPFRPVETAGYLVPQPVKDIVEAVRQKHYASAAGQAIPLAATSIPAPEEALTAATSAATNAATATVRGAAKMTNAAIADAPKILGTVGGVSGLIAGAERGGLPGAGMAGVFGAYEGARLGNYIAKSGFKVPGENFGLEPKYQPLPDMGPQRAAEVGPKPITPPQPPPESGAAAEARAYFEQRLAERKAQQPAQQPAQPAQPAPTPQLSIADQTATAKNLGFKTLAAAKAKFGEEGWQKVIGSEPKLDTPANAQQAVSDAVDKAVPNAPPSVKAEIDFKLRQGDVEGAQSALNQAKGMTAEEKLQDQADIQDLQQKMEEERIGIERYKQRMNRAASSGDFNKGSLMSPEEVVNAMPDPYGSMWENKLLGYEGRRTIAEATQIRKDAMQPKSYTDAATEFVKNNTGSPYSLLMDDGKGNVKQVALTSDAQTAESAAGYAKYFAPKWHIRVVGPEGVEAERAIGSRDFNFSPRPH